MELTAFEGSEILSLQPGSDFSKNSNKNLKKILTKKNRLIKIATFK